MHFLISRIVLGGLLIILAFLDTVIYEKLQVITANNAIFIF